MKFIHDSLSLSPSYASPSCLFSSSSLPIFSFPSGWGGEGREAGTTSWGSFSSSSSFSSASSSSSISDGILFSVFCSLVSWLWVSGGSGTLSEEREGREEEWSDGSAVEGRRGTTVREDGEEDEEEESAEEWGRTAKEEDEGVASSAKCVVVVVVDSTTTSWEEEY